MIDIQEIIEAELIRQTEDELFAEKRSAHCYLVDGYLNVNELAERLRIALSNDQKDSASD